MRYRVRQFAILAGLALSLAAILVNRHPEMVLGTLVFIVPTWGYLLLLLSPGSRQTAASRSQPVPAVRLMAPAASGGDPIGPDGLDSGERLPGRAA